MNYGYNFGALSPYIYDLLLLVGMLVLVPGIRTIFRVPDGASLLAAIIVLAIMILPTVISVSVSLNITAERSATPAIAPELSTGCATCSRNPLSVAA